MKEPLILGSASKRRKEIMDFFSLPYEQIPSSFDEEAIEFDGDPKQYVTILSRGKANDVKLHHKDRLIVTADTIVFFEGQVFNKPKTLEEANAFLKLFSGKIQHVYTGVTATLGDKMFTEVQKSSIHTRSLDEDQITKYRKAVPFHDKAGGFAVEGCSHLIVSKIDGCFYNILGLPPESLRKVLSHFGIDLWDYLKPASS